MSTYLDTILSLVFIFFIFSIIAYIFQEIIAVNLEYRGRLLWKSIAQLLDGFRQEGKNLGKNTLKTGQAVNTDALFGHPQIFTLRKTPNSYPSYIPSANFALAVMDLVGKRVPADKKTTDLFSNIKLALDLNTDKSKEIFIVLENLVATSANIKELQDKIEAWFNDYMQRVTGWYKSNTVTTIRIIAVGVTLFFNINVIKLTHEIFTNSQLRAVIVTAAMNTQANQELINTYLGQQRSAALDSIKNVYGGMLASAKNAQDSLGIQKQMADEQATAIKLYNKKSLENIDTLYQKIHAAGIPLGWSGGVLNSIFVRDSAGNYLKLDSFINILWLLLGWAIAAGCISMGAPFWFDILAKLVNVRRAGLVPGKKGPK
ncbi:MAG TPA: hypothetical protein VK625_22630 [Flavitalea sp.]|nr:hypothetical protein [Flavitalea sp.]